MSEPDKPITDLPDVVRDAKRPIIIYQTPPPVLESNATSAFLLFWLAAITLFLAIIAVCAWQVWNPNHDPDVTSPIYAEGRPIGLAKRIEERRQINAELDRLGDYLDQVRIDTSVTRPTTATHPLVTGRGGIDALREEWDAICQQIRDSVFDRRIGQLDLQIAELRRQRALRADTAQRAQLEAQIAQFEAQRAGELARRRNDGDDALRCAPAVLAPTCGPGEADAWCDTARARPGEFTAGTAGSAS